MKAFSDDCRWAPWGDWSSCTDSCSLRSGEGDQTRTREIATEEIASGTPCHPSDATEPQSCSDECPSKNTYCWCLTNNYIGQIPDSQMLPIMCR